MDSIEDILQESKHLIQTLHNQSSDTSSKNITTMDAFRGELLNFISTQLEPIKRTQAILDLVDAEIIKKLVLHEYDKNELLDVRKDLIQSVNTKTSVLLDPFKPTTGGGNILITPPSNTDTDDSALKKITPDQRIAIEKLYRIISSQPNRNVSPTEEGEE